MLKLLHSYVKVIGKGNICLELFSGSDLSLPPTLNLMSFLFSLKEVKFARKQPLARLRLTRQAGAVLSMRTEGQGPLLC